MSRSLSEVRLRAGALSLVALELRDECITIAREKSPSAAIALANQAAAQRGIAGMQALAVAKATRWLSVIRRDHGKSVFEETVRTLTQRTV